MPHILMVLDHSFPPDLRVENEAASLVGAGFEVTVLAIGPDTRNRSDSIGGVQIVRDRIPGTLRNKMRGLAGSVPFLDIYLGRLLRRLYRENRFDALHAHDLYLFGACLRAGRSLGVPVVGDMHENWVDALRHYHWSTHWPGKLVINFDRWNRLETKWSRSVDALIVVIDEMADRLAGKGIPREKMTVVPNTIRRDEFDSYPIDRELVRSLEGELTLVYTGGMDRHRGIETAIKAMPRICEAIRGAQLVLVGDGAVRRELEELGSKLGIDHAIRFEGWQPQEQIRSYIAGADIGLIPHLKTVHTDHTIPHKLFHYMYMGVPVVASDCRPLSRILTAEKAGKVYPSGDSDALVRVVLDLAGDTELREEMGRRGREAVDRAYHWEATSEGLVACYRGLLGGSDAVVNP